MIYGGVLILFMYLAPGGVMGLIRKATSATGRRREGRSKLVVTEGKTEGV